LFFVQERKKKRGKHRKRGVQIVVIREKLSIFFDKADFVRERKKGGRGGKKEKGKSFTEKKKKKKKEKKKE